MKANKLKKVFVVTSLAAAMSVSAFAANNPAGDPAGVPTSGINGPINPATAAGQGGIQQQNQTTAGANNSGTDSPSAPPMGVGNPSVKDAVADCELQEVQEVALVNAIELINAAPKVDELFNSQKEASKGCFAASSQVINLAMEIPTFSPSWSNLGNIIKGNITKMIAAKQQELLAMGCAIADQALLSAMQPIQDYMNKYTGVLGGMTGNLDMDAEYDPSKGSLWGQVSGQTQSTIDQAKARLEKDGKTASDISKNFESQYEDMLGSLPKANATPDFNPNANNNTTSPTKSGGDVVPPYCPPEMQGGRTAAPTARQQAPAYVPPATFSSPTSNNPAATERSQATNTAQQPKPKSTPF